MDSRRELSGERTRDSLGRSDVFEGLEDDATFSRGNRFEEHGHRVTLVSRSLHNMGE